jgi:hypothetical protein
VDEAMAESEGEGETDHPGEGSTESVDTAGGSEL